MAVYVHLLMVLDMAWVLLVVQRALLSLRQAWIQTRAGQGMNRLRPLLLLTVTLPLPGAACSV